MFLYVGSVENPVYMLLLWPDTSAGFGEKISRNADIPDNAGKQRNSFRADQSIPRWEEITMR